MQKTKQDAIIKNESNGALEQVPDYLQREQGQARRGNENVTREDVIVPRISLCQANSFERKKSHAKYIEGLEEGMFFNTATKEIYGKSLTVINVHFFRSRIRWKGTEIGAGMLCSSNDGLRGTGDPGGDCRVCEYAQFKQDKDDSRPECTAFMNFPCLVVGKHGEVNLADIVIASFKSIAMGAGKRWNTLVNIRNNDRFAGLYKLSSVEDHRESGDSWQPHVENAGWVMKEQFEAAAQAYSLISEWRAADRMPAPESETVVI